MEASFFAAGGARRTRIRYRDSGMIREAAGSRAFRVHAPSKTKFFMMGFLSVNLAFRFLVPVWYGLGDLPFNLWLKIDSCTENAV